MNTVHVFRVLTYRCELCENVIVPFQIKYIESLMIDVVFLAMFLFSVYNNPVFWWCVDSPRTSPRSMFAGHRKHVLS